MTAEDFITQYKNALGTQQWEAVAPLVSPEACVTFSNGSVFKGIAEIEKAYRRNFELIKNETYEMSDLHWVFRNAEVAVYVFAFSWQGFINGEHVAGKGSGTATIICKKNEWKLLAEHLGPSN